MSHPPVARSISLVLIALVVGATSVHAQTATAPAQLPVLCGDTKEVTVVIDPGADSGSAQLEFCNPSPGAPTLAATLTASDFKNRTTGMMLGGRSVFSLQKEAGADSVKLDPIAPNEARLVKVDVSKVWEAGEADASLRVNGREVAKLVARKYRLPFGVKIDAQNPDQPELTLQRGVPLDIVLRNTDSVTYEIAWEFRIAGAKETGSAIVTPNQSVAASLNADSRYFSDWPGLLRDQDADAKLTLSFRPPGVANPTYWPSKVIPVKAHLRSLSEGWRLTIINPILLLVLFAGALSSYIGSVSLPNRVKRSERNERLSGVAQRLGSISHAVDSRLRVAMRVQRKRLADLLHSRKSISADLVNVLNQVADGTTLLEQQVSLAERIDDAHRRMKYLDVRGAAPSLLAEAEELVWKAADQISHVCPDASRMQRSAEYLDLAEAKMKQAEQPNQDLANKAAQDLKTAQDRLLPYVATDVFKNVIAPAFPDLAVPSVAINLTPAVSETAKLDRNAIKCDLVREFIEVSIATLDDAARKKLDAQLARLMREIALASYQRVRRARLLVREAQEGVYPEDLSQGPPPEIRMDPASPRPNDPITFSVSFNSVRLNESAARLEYEGRWSFGHDDFAESGWELVHYFPHDGRYPVKFTASSGVESERLDASKDATAVPAPREWWKRDRNRAEVLRFFITLVPAMIGLLSGAREQFLKMDLWAATFAVFLLGFGSDTVKNLVSQSQPATAKPSPTPAPATSPAQTVPAPAGAQKPATT